jgi:voltage-gated potassium channel
VIREELSRLTSWEDRHRRLVSRLAIALGLTVVVDVVGAVLVWRLERHAQGTEIHSLGDALFFSTVQLLTVSSQLKNPLTTAGRFVDVALEIWALVVVTSVAGSFAAFFASGDRPAPS